MVKSKQGSSRARISALLHEEYDCWCWDAAENQRLAPRRGVLPTFSADLSAHLALSLDKEVTVHVVQISAAA
jgi:hypothetical protein